ncbi:hypothetical protein TNCV_3007411 [Trichonephila clavipes]|nr:hypothetical protein TNCV_3007411 [Trichonephila clavipes]
MNETTQQEKTTQLGSRNETTQLVSRNETAQLCTAVDRLRPPTTPTTACNRLQPPATACIRLHRFYSRIGFFYLLTCIAALHGGSFVALGSNSRHANHDSIH